MGNVDAGLGFRDRAVVHLDLGGFAEDENALNGFAAAGNDNALSHGVGVRPDGDRDFSGGVAGI